METKCMQWYYWKVNYIPCRKRQGRCHHNLSVGQWYDEPLFFLFAFLYSPNHHIGHLSILQHESTVNGETINSQVLGEIFHWSHTVAKDSEHMHVQITPLLSPAHPGCRAMFQCLKSRDQSKDQELECDYEKCTPAYGSFCSVSYLFTPNSAKEIQDFFFLHINWSRAAAYVLFSGGEKTREPLLLARHSLNSDAFQDSWQKEVSGQVWILSDYPLELSFRCDRFTSCWGKERIPGRT